MAGIQIREKCTIFVHSEPITKILKRPPSQKNRIANGRIYFVREDADSIDQSSLFISREEGNCSCLSC